MSETASVTDEEFLRPATPEVKSGQQAKKRHRRAKGKRKKQKTCLMITNDDGTDSTVQEPLANQKKIYLRPSNNPLLKAPKNSTQFIIDDHENSNLFLNFDGHEAEGADHHRAGHIGLHPGQFFGQEESDRLSPDDDSFWAEYSERDFESVYETAHQEEIYSWDKDKIIQEISCMEKKRKHLIDVLSAVDPIIYLQKLQAELLTHQEENRLLKLGRSTSGGGGGGNGNGGGGIKKKGSSENSPRLPDSTTEEANSEGGCSSGCCLRDDGCDNSSSDIDDMVEAAESSRASAAAARLDDEDSSSCSSSSSSCSSYDSPTPGGDEQLTSKPAGGDETREEGGGGSQEEQAGAAEEAASQAQSDEND